jgi:perosamine synthetase|tara:strand:- start:2295 stop:3422 length:1128 start_codon:yes stop_codon:yes gene_type:complete
MKPIEMAGPWVTEYEESLVLDALRNGWYGKDAYKYCEKFESEFAAYHDRKYALMTPNCTTALHLLLAGLGIEEGDEVIVPECTWVGSSACITYQRATTVFADIDPINWCITPQSLERAITGKTKAVIVVDLYGNMPQMEALQAVADENGIALIEDAAEAVGSMYDGVRAGKFGIGSAFSFHRTKTITTGEGGMLLIDDEPLFERCKLLRDHGRRPGSYYNEEITFKYMPFNIQAALGLGQFHRIDELVDRKRWMWKLYKERLADIPEVQLNPEPEGTLNGVWCTAAVFDSSLGITGLAAQSYLKENDMPSRPFFFPLSSLPAYGSQEAVASKLRPIAYDVSSRGICLPCALNTTEEQIHLYTNVVRKMLNHSKLN